MVVGCPKCKTRLKIPDEKIAPGGSKFKCPKCAAILLVKKPAPTVEKAVIGKELDLNKIIVAHADQSIIERIKSALSASGKNILQSTDGVDMMVKTLRELPSMAIVDVALPKIYGFEVCKRLREREETKQMKMILLSSIYDKTRYKREPVSLYGADDYIDEHLIEAELLKRVNALFSSTTTGLKEEPETKEEAPAMPRPGPAVSAPPRPEAVSPAPPSAVPPAAVPPVAAPKAGPKPQAALDMVEKARRLARIILSDIYLYSAQKVEDSIRNNNFSQAFAAELKEGLKLYDNRIPADIRSKRDFFKEEMENFINIRKKTLGL